MNVLVVEPGFFPYEKKVNGIAEMEKIVRGNFEAIYPFDDDVAVVINDSRENGKAQFNRTISERSYGSIYGTFFICGISGDHFTSLSPEQMNRYKLRFAQIEQVPIYEAEHPRPMAQVLSVTSLTPKGKPKRQQKPPGR